MGVHTCMKSFIWTQNRFSRPVSLDLIGCRSPREYWWGSSSLETRICAPVFGSAVCRRYRRKRSMMKDFPVRNAPTTHAGGEAGTFTSGWYSVYSLEPTTGKKGKTRINIMSQLSGLPLTTDPLTSGSKPCTHQNHHGTPNNKTIKILLQTVHNIVRTYDPKKAFNRE